MFISDSSWLLKEGDVNEKIFFQFKTGQENALGTGGCLRISSADCPWDLSSPVVAEQSGRRHL